MYSMKIISFSTPVAFATISFFLGNLGDGLNIFQGIFLVNLGWNEGSVGIALSLMGFTALVCQTFAGDAIDKTTFDRRKILVIASLMTACSATTVMFVREGNNDHMLMYITKIIEGLASSFIGPCLAALTLACNGPDNFDSTMANNVLWGHIGSATSAVLAGGIAYFLYPDIKYCFLVIGFSALLAIVFIQFLPEGDKNLARGFEKITSDCNDTEISETSKAHPSQMEAASYLSVISEPKTLTLCLTGFFFHFANANVLLVLGELMSRGDNNNGDDDGGNAGTSRSAIPLVGGAILLAQATMSLATIFGDKCTKQGIGRKVLFIAGLITLPLRCALIIGWKDSGNGFLLSTQILDGVGGGFFGLLHPYLVADITFGTGRFNLIMGLTASCFGLGGTLSNFLGQMVVEKFGHIISLAGSFFISFIPIIIFTALMPETLNTRGKNTKHAHVTNECEYSAMI
jgi:MFS family permease